jgi:dihydropteroate synthase
MSKLEWRLPRNVLTFGSRPLILGIVNVTPDSFSDGGRYNAADAAIAHGLELESQGADLLDVGGESTRPGAVTVSADEELQRVVPVVRELATRTRVPISVDTSKAVVARACLDAGAQIINDVTGLADSSMVDIVRSARVGAIVMHMQGTPATMQQAPSYSDVVAEVGQFFEDRLRDLARHGVESDQLVLDPGIGFGKTSQHNLALVSHLAEYQRFRRPVCLGVSRKAFLGRLLDRPVDQRLPASVAAALFAQARAAVQIVRVHDVAATRDAITMFSILAEAAK